MESLPNIHGYQITEAQVEALALHMQHIGSFVEPTLTAFAEIQLKIPAHICPIFVHLVLMDSKRVQALRLTGKNEAGDLIWEWQL